MARRRVLSGLRAVAYVRVSTDEQHLGPSAQRKAIEAYARRAGIEIVAWCSDEGVSGRTPLGERQGLLQAILAMGEHQAGVLIAAKRDRLARDRIVAATIEQEVRKAGGVVRTADGASDADGSDGILRKGIEDLFSEVERHRIAERTKAALSVKRARGERAGTIPYGMRVDVDGVRLVADESEQAVIRRIVDLAREGMSTYRIADVLAIEGIRGRAGKPLSQVQVWRIVSRSREAA